MVVGSGPEAVAAGSPGLVGVVHGLCDCGACERDQNKTEEDQEGRIDL